MKREIQAIKFAGTVIGLPFQWGQTDCMMIALRWLDEVLDRDISSALRGTYTTKEEAAALLATIDVSDYCRQLGLSQVERPQAGDVVVRPCDPWPHVAHVMVGSRFLSAAEEYGVVMLDQLRGFLDGAAVWRP